MEGMGHEIPRVGFTYMLSLCDIEPKLSGEIGRKQLLKYIFICLCNRFCFFVVELCKNSFLDMCFKIVIGKQLLYKGLHSDSL